MEDGELKIGNVQEEWTAVASHLSLSQLDHLERVHIQCVQSTDFVLGRQTNFNGPVTIINCQDVLKKAAHVQEEEVVIREKVLSQSAIHQMATSSQQNGVNSPHSTTSTTRFFRIKTPFVLTGIFVAAVVAASTFLTMSSTKDEQETFKCTFITDDICLYSQFHWGGRPMPPRVVPLPLPVQYLAISSTTDDDDYCYDFKECLRVVERMQLKQAVPECNFLLGNEGNVYEDRGWEVATASEGPLTQRLHVCFLGDHTTDWPTYPSVEAFHALAKFGVERKYVAEDYGVVGWQLSEVLHKVISKWPRFCNESEPAGCQGSRSELSVIRQISNPRGDMEDNMVVCAGWKGVEGAQGGPRGEGEVSIECLQSSEFVVGKQANFNGAVTIINCTEAPGVKEGKVKTEENIVIRDKVVTEPSQGGNDSKRKLADLKQIFIKWRAEHTKLALFFLFLLIFIGVLTMTAIAWLVLLPKEPTPPQIVNSTDSHPFYSKKAWKGKPATSSVKMKLPVPYVVVSHTVTPQCYNLTSCAASLQQMQNYHFTRKFGDIAYNFLMDSNGGIYEGRGWERRNANGGFVHSRSVDIALMGDFSQNDEPSERMMEGLKYLLAFGVADGKLAEDYSLVAANDTYATLSPGKNVYKVIKGWPHFDDNPKAHIKE